MKGFGWIAAATVALVLAPAAKAQPLRPDQTSFRALYQELVETDTSITTGSCTALADKVEARLRGVGYGDDQITRFAAPDHPKEGGLVVVLPGTSKVLKPLLLLGHIDVVVARSEDWTRDPYKLVEENGYFYGRGTQDMKGMDAIWIDAMMRFKQSAIGPSALSSLRSPAVRRRAGPSTAPSGWRRTSPT